MVKVPPEEREAYEDHLKWLRVEASTLKKYRQEGRAEGLAEGFEKGIKQEKFAMALKLLNRHFSIAEIIDLTGISKDEFQDLIAKTKDKNGEI